MQRYCFLNALGLLICVTYTSFAANAYAVGRWNMPSTTSQWFGAGFGAGYHGPLVLGRSWRTSAASPGVRRVSHPLPMFDHHHDYGESGAVILPESTHAPLSSGPAPAERVSAPFGDKSITGAGISTAASPHLFAPPHMGGVGAEAVSNRGSREASSEFLPFPPQ